MPGYTRHENLCGRCDTPPNFDFTMAFQPLVDAEGVETIEEARWLYRQGIAKQQGYWFAKPVAGELPACPDSRFALVRAEN